ncbi:hypothetical protein CR513_53714, partial [Mucuna pruriens]
MNCGRVINPTYLIFTLLDIREHSRDTQLHPKHRVYNSRTLMVEESIHMKFNDCKLDKELL